jgi:hypothetical protein
MRAGDYAQAQSPWSSSFNAGLNPALLPRPAFAGQSVHFSAISEGLALPENQPFQIPLTPSNIARGILSFSGVPDPPVFAKFFFLQVLRGIMMQFFAKFLYLLDLHPLRPCQGGSGAERTPYFHFSNFPHNSFHCGRWYKVHKTNCLFERPRQEGLDRIFPQPSPDCDLSLDSCVGDLQLVEKVVEHRDDGN